MNSILSIDSNPQSAAPAATSPSSHQGRRAACNRCRGQKLKCIREDQNGNAIQSGKCIRCNSAGATCSFSTSMRSGRPPISSSSTSPTERRGKQKPGQGGPRTKASSAGRNCPDAKHNDLHGLESENRLSRMFPDEEDGEMDTGHGASSADELVAGSLHPPSMPDALSFPTYPDSAGADMAWSDGGMTTFYDGEDLVNIETFGTDYNWSFLQPPALPKNRLIPAASSPSGTNCQASRTDLDQNSRLSNELQMSDSPRSIGGTPAFLDPASRKSDSQIGTAGDTREREEGPINFSMRDPNEYGSGRRTSSEDTRSMSSGNEAQHRRMQQTSELTMILYSLIVTNDQRQHSHSTTTITPSSLAYSLQDQFVGSVLKHSTTFLKILTSFYPSTSSSSSTQPSTQCSVLSSSDSDASASDSASIFSDFATTTIVNKMRSRQGSSLRKHDSVASKSAFSNSNDNGLPSKPISADMSTVFSLLTCYIRIIHLHSILYARILDHLLASLLPRNHDNNQNQQPPPIFPGMQVGGVSLDDFRDFQIKFILQISTHVLGEIEMALGLPDGFRISRRTPGTTGVLETSVSVQFIETTMREIETTMRTTVNENRNEMGLGVEKGMVNSIRENLFRLKQLLKGTINI